jgi:hypothetical protein
MWQLLPENPEPKVSFIVHTRGEAEISNLGRILNPLLGRGIDVILGIAPND